MSEALLIERLETRICLSSLNSPGSSLGAFVSALPASAVTSGLDTTHFSFGNGLSSSLSFASRKFTVGDSETPFWVGTLSYSNGETHGNEPDSVDINVRVTITVQDKPVTIERTYRFGLINTANTSDPQASADFVNFPQSSENGTTFTGPDGATYTLRLLGFGKVSGSGFIAENQFRVLEGGTATTRLLGELTVAPQIRALDASGASRKKFSISAAPEMPRITFEIIGFGSGALNGVEVAWSGVLRHRQDLDKPILKSRNVTGHSVGRTKTGPKYTPEYPSVRGGNSYVMRASLTVNGRPYDLESPRFEVIGTNPAVEVVKEYLNSKTQPSSWPSTTEYNYNTILRQIVRQESIYQQFRSNGSPYWSGDQHGGTGLMQVTPFGSPEQVWNWRSQIDAGVAGFNAKWDEARDWGTRHPSLSGVAAAITQRGVALGLDPLPIQRFTKSMAIREAVERYNGGNKYRILVDLDPPDPSTIVVQSIQDVQTAIWSDVALTNDDNDYAAEVLARSE